LRALRNSLWRHFFSRVVNTLRHHREKAENTSEGAFTQAIFVAQLNAIFVALKLQLQYRTCKPAAISARF